MSVTQPTKTTLARRSPRISLRAYHPIVRTLLGGTLLVNLFRSMCYPFVAVYLSRRTDMSLEMIGLLVGMGALASTFGGFFGGVLSDRFGRKHVMLASLAVSSAFYVAYGVTTLPWLLMAFMLLFGFCGTFFDPVSRALMSDLTPPELRGAMFSLRYWAINAGYALGPMIGMWLGMTGRPSTFVLMGCIDALYLLVLFWRVKKADLSSAVESSPASTAHQDRQQFGTAARTALRDRALLWLIIGGILSTTVHGRWSVPLSEYLITLLSNGEPIFQILLTVNSLAVVFFQPLLNRYFTQGHPMRLVAIGSVLFALGEVGFALSHSGLWFVLSMIVFTIGEVMVLPAESLLIDHITPAGVRGTYYGAQSFTSLGNFLGPWLSNLFLARVGGPPLFGCLAIVALISIFAYQRGMTFVRSERASVH